ncbi:hypothetical protein ACVWXL_009324 [Bradyrhizobium sp. GM22.5]
MKTVGGVSDCGRYRLAHRVREQSHYKHADIEMELSPNFGDGRSRSGRGGYGLAVGRLADDLDPIIECHTDNEFWQLVVAIETAPFVARVIIANPLQVKAIAQAHVKTDKIDAGTLASLQAAGYLPQIWTPDAETERKRRLVARRYQVVRHRTRLKNEVHSILHAHLIPKCPHADLFNGRGRAWLAAQPLPDDERAAIDRHVRELDRLAEDLALLDREIAQDAIDDSAVNRLMTITGVTWRSLPASWRRSATSAGSTARRSW